MVADYKYFFCNIDPSGGVNEQVLQEIDLYGVYLSGTLNGGDSQFDGTFQLDQTGKNNGDLIEATHPGRRYVVVERNGQPIGAWIIWSRVYSAQSKTVQMHGLPFDAYPNYQRILVNTAYNTNQITIFRNLWTAIQGGANRNLGIVVPGSSPSSITKAIDVKATDYRYYGEIISSLADAEDGFDWYIYIQKSGTQYQKIIRVGYPTLGTPLADSVPVFEYPGNVTQYYMTESMAGSGTNVIVLGAGEGSDMITKTVNHTDLLTSGMPRWDVDVPRKDITSQSLLNTVGTQIATNLRSPRLTVRVTIKGDRTPEFGSYNLGDACKVVIKDPRNPTGYTKDTRLIAWSLRPPTSEQVEEANLLFEGSEEDA